jgi:hypothetical protein
MDLDNMGRSDGHALSDIDDERQCDYYYVESQIDR